MKKLFMSLAAFMLSLAINAQGTINLERSDELILPSSIAMQSQGIDAKKERKKERKKVTTPLHVSHPTKGI